MTSKVTTSGRFPSGGDIAMQIFNEAAAKLKRQRCPVHGESPENVRVSKGSKGPIINAAFCCEKFEESAIKRVLPN
jgi:hypothetical protein